jgi:hypothetical protein
VALENQAHNPTPPPRHSWGQSLWCSPVSSQPLLALALSFYSGLLQLPTTCSLVIDIVASLLFDGLFQVLLIVVLPVVALFQWDAVPLLVSLGIGASDWLALLAEDLTRKFWPDANDSN